MECYIILVLASLFLLKCSKHKDKALKIVFSFIIIFSSFRSNYGSDYPSYLRIFINLNSVGWEHYDYEIGWVILNRLVPSFRALLIITSLFNNIVIYNLIKRYVIKSYYWLAVFIYLINPDLYLIELSMMRQAVATSLVILAFMACTDKDYLKSLLFMAASICFHTTALICVVMYPLYFLMEKKKLLTMMVVMFFIFCIVATAFLSDSLFQFISLLEMEQYNEHMVAREEVSWGIGVLLKLLISTFLLFKYNKISDNSRAISLTLLLAIISIFFIPLSQISVLMMRLGYYFVIFNIIAIPYALNVTKNCVFRKFMLALVVVLYIYSLYAFLNDEFVGASYLTYKFSLLN